jgi:hypothetical protein
MGFLFYFPLLIGVAALAPVVMSFFAFGQVHRNAGAQFGFGSYAALQGALFLLPLVFEDRQPDEFLNNWIGGQVYLWVGTIILICSLIGLGMKGKIVVLLVILNLILLGILLDPHFLPWVLVYACVLMALGLIIASKRHQRQVAGQGILLAVGGTTLVALVYYLLGGRYQDASGRIIETPYLNEPVTLFSLALGLLLFVVLRAWSASRLPL